MGKLSGIAAIGAGFASALLFVVSAKGTSSAVVVAYFTALPIMIAAIGFGHVSGLVGAAVGCLAVSLALGPILAGFFALAFALPGWWLAYLGLMARPAVAGSDATTPAPASALSWYPIGRLMAWAAASACLATLMMGGLALFRFGGYEGALAALTRDLTEALGPTPSTGDMDAGDFAGIVVRIFPAALAASSFLMLIANLWVAGRVAELSQRLRRPWPNVPDGLRLPREAVAAIALGIVPVLADGAVPTACGTVAAAFMMGFAMQGLGTAHVLTRGFAARGAILAMIYIVAVGTMPLSLIALGILGILDCLMPSRFRRPPTPLPPKPKGETPWK